MNHPGETAGATGFWRVVFLLLGASRRRAVGRRTRQQELMRRRSKKPTTNWNGLAGFGAFALAVGIHGVAAYVVSCAVVAGQRIEAERHGQVVVDRWFKTQVERSVASASRASDPPAFGGNPGLHLTPRSSTSDPARAFGGEIADKLHGRRPRANFSPAPVDPRPPVYDDLESAYDSEARHLANRAGGSTASVIEGKLRAVVGRSGASELVASADATPGLAGLGDNRSMPALMGSVVLLWWAVMLVFQGEGLELDLQRRRHPMWEWLYSHPVPAGAIFTAEMLAPVAANPIYWAAPLFAGGVYGMVYDPLVGALAALAVGVPVALAAACLGKALEIGSVIRFSPRSRGALLGFMSWIGYASMMLFLFGATSAPQAAAAVGPSLIPLTAVPWPWLGWFVGRQADGSFSFVAGMLACWAASGLTGALAVRFCRWGAGEGLSGNFGPANVPKAAAAARPYQFGRDPLYRKEFLWFIRDRSAIVQTILIPLTVAGVQMFNLRGLLASAQGSWNYLSGAAVLFGTYFLWVLGPKSLASEGSALWLALTWPRGLESLLKAKAWLWSMIATGIVTLTLGYAVFLFPAEAWKVALVGAGWLVFGRSMAEKTVTLVSVTSSSGDPEPIPRGRRWAASLGMLTFAIGVLTQQWNLVVVGIVYSYITAAAMWENFRARLPFLYDPWSEKLPPPPTLMHAMVSISVLVEGGAVLSAPIIAVAGRDNFAVGRSVAYAVCALAVSIGVWRFLAAREVRAADIWCWRAGPGDIALVRSARRWWCGDGSHRGRFALAMLMGVAGGLALGGLARSYVAVLLHFPTTGDLIRHGQEQMERLPGLKASYAFCAVAVAPFAEEFLFRGLLFRALDREWGGWRAILGSAAFFAIYHPTLAWVPVGLLGVANAVLFKQTGRLAPAVALHMVYNAVVTLLT